MLDAGQIVDDLAPISRLEGDIFYRGSSILGSRLSLLAARVSILDIMIYFPLIKEPIPLER